MPLEFNGNTVNAVTFNGSTVNEVLFNGVHVWPDSGIRVRYNLQRYSYIPPLDSTEVARGYGVFSTYQSGQYSSANGDISGIAYMIPNSGIINIRAYAQSDSGSLVRVGSVIYLEGVKVAEGQREIEGTSYCDYNLMVDTDAYYIRGSMKQESGTGARLYVIDISRD